MRGAARASKSEPCCRTQEFCQCIHRDYAAVYEAYAWLQSNGAVEGTVNKLKLIKRLCYSRAGFALLRERILHAL